MAVSPKEPTTCESHLTNNLKPTTDVQVRPERISLTIRCTSQLAGKITGVDIFLSHLLLLLFKFF